MGENIVGGGETKRREQLHAALLTLVLGVDESNRVAAKLLGVALVIIGQLLLLLLSSRSEVGAGENIQLLLPDELNPLRLCDPKGNMFARSTEPGFKG